MVISPGQWKRWPRVAKPAEIPPISHAINRSPNSATMPDSGRTQRRLSLFALSRPQRIDLGQAKARTIAGIASASTSFVARPGLSITANQTPSRSSSRSCVSPVLRRKPSSACGGALVRGPFNSSLTAAVASGRSFAISASRRGVDQTVRSPTASPAAIRARNSFSSSARAPACIRAGISSLRSSRRKSVIAHPPRLRGGGPCRRHGGRGYRP